MSTPSRIDDLKILNAFALHSEDRLLTALHDYDAAILELDGTTIVDKASLMARLPLDIGLPDGMDPPDGWAPRNWNGFNDILWQLLAERPAPMTVLIWRHAEMMLEHSINDFLMALTVFGDVARAVSTTNTGFPLAMQFRLVLLGEGTMFPPFAG